jgi:hypothetical protein
MRARCRWGLKCMWTNPSGDSLVRDAPEGLRAKRRESRSSDPSRGMRVGAGGGRAEGMRRAMRALIENGAAHEAHPSYWAPFVIVCKGAAAR